jgi:hypothetical protein
VANQIPSHAVLPEHVQHIENFLGLELHAGGGFVDPPDVEIGVLFGGRFAHAGEF